jgi:signal transduction histidine kinase
LYADTRELILGLRAVTAPQRDLITALTEYCQHFAVFCELPVTCELSELADENFSPMVELQLLRITQEALSNIRKHAHATRAEVRGRRDDDWDVIEIQDNGRGFNPADLGESNLPRFGLQSMRERVTSIGGTLQLKSAPGRGTHIIVVIPRLVHGTAEIRA